MKKKEKIIDCCPQSPVSKNNCCHKNGGSNAIYGLSVIGALFYFLQGVNTFETIIIGIGKAIFWPAILMFKLLTYLQL